MRVIVTAGVAAGMLSPAPSLAQEPSAEEQLEDVRAQAEAVAAEIDVISAEDA